MSVSALRDRPSHEGGFEVGSCFTHCTKLSLSLPSGISTTLTDLSAPVASSGTQAVARAKLASKHCGTNRCSTMLFSSLLSNALSMRPP